MQVCLSIRLRTVMYERLSNMEKTTMFMFYFLKKCAQVLALLLVKVKR